MKMEKAMSNQNLISVKTVMIEPIYSNLQLGRNSNLSCISLPHQSLLKTFTHKNNRTTLIHITPTSSSTTH
ncbi:hypothetical protein ABTM97_19920, partial [Acinetobacter baumannii]